MAALTMNRGPTTFTFDDDEPLLSTLILLQVEKRRFDKQQMTRL